MASEAGALSHDALVLFVEDSDDDWFAYSRLLDRHYPELGTFRVATAEAASTWLHAQLDDDAGCLPRLVVLDLNLPGRDGRALLEELGRSPELSTIPVVIFSTSAHPDDIRECFRLHVNAYHQKPMGLTEMREELSRILDYWTADRSCLPKLSRRWARSSAG